MPALDLRVVRIGIEINGAIKYFDDLFIYASGTKYGSGLMNECDVKVSNLNKADRDWLLTAVSPYNLNRTPKKLTLEAGRQSIGLKGIITGDIIRAEVSQPPDITITFKVRTSAFESGSIVSSSHGAATPSSQIAQGVADDLGLSLDFQASDKNISNYSYTGGALKQVDHLADLGGVDAFVDDKVLVVKDKGKPLKGRSLLINDETGMIGIPQLDIQGVTVKFLIDAFPVLGSEITIQSKLYPAVNGSYTIYKLDFEIANRDTPFYWVARASRAGFGAF